MATKNVFSLRNIVGTGISVLVMTIGTLEIWSELQPAAFPEAEHAFKINSVTGSWFKVCHEPADLRDGRTSQLFVQSQSVSLPEIETWASNLPSKIALDVSRLKGLIAERNLSANQCFQIGEVIAHGPRFPEAQEWIAAGFQRTKGLLDSSKPSDKSIHPVLVTMENAQDALAGHIEAAALLEQMNASIMRFDRFAPWDQTPEWARIHHADALVLEGRNAEAKIETDEMSRDARAGSHWTHQEKMELQSVIARIPFAPDAISPLEVLQIHRPPPQKLIEWMEKWQTARIKRGSKDANIILVSGMADPADTIGKSGLSAMECLRISELMADADDPPNEVTFAVAGATRAAIEFANVTSQDPSGLLIINALERAQDRLWKSPGDTPNRNIAIETITHLLMRFDRTAQWDQTPEWAKIRHADAILREGRYAETKIETDAMSHDADFDPHWTTQEKIELQSLIVRLPFAPNATSPIEILQAHRPPPQELITWMQNWKNVWANPRSDNNQIFLEWEASTLTGMIVRSNLSAVECLRISELMSDAEDTLGAEAFADAGTNCATAELSQINAQNVAALPVIRALERAEDRLWESSGDAVTRGMTLEKITSILLRFGREDPQDQTPEWARIGHGEALYMQHRYSEAMAEANKLAADVAVDSHFTDQQKVGIEWLQALLLFDARHYQEALPHLEVTATHSSFHHSRDAWPLWAVALAKSGNSTSASRVLDLWIRRDRPAIKTVARVLEVIQAQ